MSQEQQILINILERLESIEKKINNMPVVENSVTGKQCIDLDGKPLTEGDGYRTVDRTTDCTCRNGVLMCDKVKQGFLQGIGEMFTNLFQQNRPVEDTITTTQSTIIEAVPEPAVPKTAPIIAPSEPLFKPPTGSIDSVIKKWDEPKNEIVKPLMNFQKWNEPPQPQALPPTNNFPSKFSDNSGKYEEYDDEFDPDEYDDEDDPDEYNKYDEYGPDVETPASVLGNNNFRRNDNNLQRPGNFRGSNLDLGDLDVNEMDTQTQKLPGQMLQNTGPQSGGKRRVRFFN
jgi:hypothetical protein